jgi:hypothetical protein
MSTLAQLDRTILLCRDYVEDGLSNDAIAESFESLRVLCVADERNLSSHSGQSCLTTLVALLSRMGMQVTLAIPEISVILQQPPFLGAFLRKTLLAWSNTLVTAAGVQLHDGEDKPDLVFILGDSQAEQNPCPAWRLGGGDWSGTITQEPAARVHVWRAHWPVGAMVSAALAAGEAFKHVIRRLPFRNREDKVFFEPSSASNWDFGSVGVPEGVLDLGEVDIVSAGAISQAALYALLRIPNLRMTGRVFDDDTTGETNLNRNMLSLVSDVGLAKVLLVANRCSPYFYLTPKRQRFAANHGIERLAPHVLVGVDDIPSRWLVQRHASGVLVVSGTSHFSISSSSHTPTSPCCGCQHPVDDLVGPVTIPTVSFVSFWAGLAMAVRLIRHLVGAPYPLDHQHLWFTPLRMDQPYAALWSPVAPRLDCPVRCVRSRHAA